MKGDNSRQTFARKNHYSSVRMQQGRVQLDADWNEQADIVTHREDVTTRDLIGGCGGPLGGAAFAVKVLTRVLIDSTERTRGTAVEVARDSAPADAERRAADPSGIRPADTSGIRIEPSGTSPFRLPRPGRGGDDFTLSAGRYYVDGILCENEQAVRYSAQPDFPEATTFGHAPFDVEGLYLLYLDVWRRHLTALDDPRIRETALGGPDTATRAKTIWQAKLWKAPGAAAALCPDVFSKFWQSEVARNVGLLNASTVPEDPGSNPCIVPPSAGFRGLENLLYRVEVHTGGVAADAGSNGGSVRITGFSSSARNELTLEAGGAAPSVGDAIELYPSKTGSDPMAGRLYFVTNVNGQTVTLSRDITGLELAQEPRLRKADATFKWSRQNGSVVTKIEKISLEDNKQITVQSLGPDEALGFSDGDWVELTDDLTELRGEPGQLTQIVSADGATRTVVLKEAPTSVVISQNAKMRRWDGIAPIRTNKADAEKGWITLENGLRIQFPSTGASGSVKPPTYVTGDYWLIPTRTATADRESGQIEWPQDKSSGKPVPQPPEGIEHHYCPLALLDWSKAKGLTVVTDCRRLFPPVTALTTLHYVSGTGQEATPVLPPTPQSLVELLHPLVVGVSNGNVPVEGARVVFEVVEGELNPAPPGPPSDFPNGRLSAAPGGNALVISDTKIEVLTDADGLAACKWELSPVRWNQQVVARLLGPDHQPMHLPVRFNANLSIAREVAYEPGVCDKLADTKTVQEALDKLCELLGLANEPGVHVTDVSFGAPSPTQPPDDRPEVIDNDFDLSSAALSEGLRVTCDQEVFPGSLKNKPTCFVSLELPYPSSLSEKDAWGLKSTDRTFFGYQTIVLDGSAVAEGRFIIWKPSTFAAQWLRTSLPAAISRFEPSEGTRRPGRVLAHLTLKGNFIWSNKDAAVYLDGEFFGVNEQGSAATSLRAPSGNGMRGGDLELWFWLVQFKVSLDKEALNIGETTKGRVTLSGPAPQKGATVQLTVRDAAIAKLGQSKVVIKEGDDSAAFEVTGVGQGQTVISAFYVGGEQQVSVNVISSPPPRVEVVRIFSRQETNGFQQLAEMNPSTGLPADGVLIVPIWQFPNGIQVKFTDDAPVNLAAITAKSFIVQILSTGGIASGSVSVVQGSNAVVWRASQNQVLPAGEYRITLVGDAVPEAITSVKGKRLDGEPTSLPSGNGQEGGNFRFVLRVEPSPPAANQPALLKVKRVALINKGTSETVIFQTKEGVFDNNIQVPPGIPRPNVIEIEFTGGPVNKGTVKANASFIVRRIAQGAVPVDGRLDWMSDSVLRWTPSTALTRGNYSVVLLSGIDPITNQAGTLKIAGTDGRGLDGEPTKLPSGNNTADGTFFFTMQMP